MPITKEHRQEALSLAWLHAIASACGLTCSFRTLDYGVDVTLHYIEAAGGVLFESIFRIDVQLKSTTAALFDDEHIRYDLDVRNYDHLREPNPFVPRILALLVLPEDESLWIDVSEEQLTMRRCMYWHWLAGSAPTSNKRTIRVAIPRSNVLSVEGLKQLLSKFDQGELE